MPTDYTVGDRDHWVEVARKRGRMIARLIAETDSQAEEINELDARVAELEAELEALRAGKRRKRS